MSQIVIYGNGQLSTLAWYCLTHDSPHDVCGFTVDEHCLTADRFHDKPIVPFAEVENRFPPDQFEMLLPIGYHDGNRLRADRYLSAKTQGYVFASYISSRASVWPDLQIGDNCMIYEQAVIAPFTRIGNNVIIRSGVHVSHDCRIEDHGYLAPRACLGGCVTVERHCVVGLNATVKDNLRLAAGSLVAAGAVLLRDTQAHCVYIGNPARKSAVRAEGGALD